MEERHVKKTFKMNGTLTSIEGQVERLWQRKT